MHVAKLAIAPELRIGTSLQTQQPITLYILTLRKFFLWHSSVISGWWGM